MRLKVALKGSFSDRGCDRAGLAGILPYAGHASISSRIRVQSLHAVYEG